MLEHMSELAGQLDPNYHDLPSWSYGNFESQVSEAVPRLSSPHPHKKASIRFEQNNMIMVLRGHILDSILTTTDQFMEPSWMQQDADMLRIHSQILLTLNTLLQNVNDGIRGIENFVNAWRAGVPWGVPDEQINTVGFFWCFFRWVTGYVDYLTSGASRATEPLCAVLPPLIQRVRALVGESIHQRHPDGNSEQLLEALPGLSESSDFWCPVSREEAAMAKKVWECRIFHGRSFGISRQQWICNTTGQVKSGDAIAVLEGGYRAFVLQSMENTGTYRYIGTAYVPRFMNGEAYKDKSPEEIDEEIRLV